MKHVDHNSIKANTERYIQAGLDHSFLEDMARVVSALHQAGFDPYDQLTGFARTGNKLYITRLDGAREIVSWMDVQHIRVFLSRYREQKA